MQSQVLYLFNSALRPAYRENLYKILALPPGCVTQFRYTTKNHVPRSLDLPSLVDKECYIVFVDRFSPGEYTYYPIRKGKIIKTSSGANRTFLQCRLGEYCSSADPIEFTKLLKNSAENPPELTDGDPGCTKDGYYVQNGEDLLKYLYFGEDSWEENVERIVNTKSFAHGQSAFLKASIIFPTRGKQPIVQEGRGSICVKSGESFIAELLYYDPDEGRNEKRITLDVQYPIKAYGPMGTDLGALTDLFSIELDSDNVIRSTRSNINTSVYFGESREYSIDIPIEVSSWRMICGVILYSAIIISMIIFQSCPVVKSAVSLSVITELIKWGAAFRIFYECGRLPVSPLQP